MLSFVDGGRSDEEAVAVREKLLLDSCVES